MKQILFIILLITLKFQAQTPGIKYAYIDSTANPRNDFYSFCNGKWQKTFELPESDARYGSFNEINENNLVKIKRILDAASKNKLAKPGTESQKLRDFYNTAMDSLKATADGNAPILEQLNKIELAKNLDDFMAVKSDFDYLGINLIFGIGVSPDLKNSKKNSLSISQAGFGLGDRDYYYLDKFEQIRIAYRKYIAELFKLSGMDANTAETDASEVLDFEKNLTNKAMTRVEMRDVEKLYNVYTPSTLKQLAPAINWTEYFKRKNMKQPDTVIVSMVAYTEKLGAFLGNVPLHILKVYAKAQLLMEAAPYLSDKFVDVHFDFRGRVLSGAQQMKPRWQRVQNTMNNTIGDIVSKEFVKSYFPPEAKVKINKLIDNLILAYRERIASRTWMSEETKKQANRKLNLLIRKVGYPDKWKDYNKLNIGVDSYWDNVCRANRFLTQDNFDELKKPVDRKKWQMTPVTVNAYYDPTTNEITFPAAILQPPFYDPKAEDAANYGTIGAIIGHELTHGFDDQGSQFDAEGNMKMWWTENDYKNFKDKTKRIVNQFDAYIAIDTLHVNGDMTQGENIADIGGLTMAYYAYKKTLAGGKSKMMGGYTGEQRFFIAWAQGWKSVVRDAETKRLLTMDYHSPAYFRAFAPLSNMKEFYDAFGVKPGDKMFTGEDKRVEIW